jgi:transposase
MRRLTLALAAGLTLSGCGTIGLGDERRDQGPEFVGRTIRVEAAGGQVTRLSFRRDGTVRARFGERETNGRWSLERRQLCFTWAQNFRECWPYRRAFQRGRTVALTSSRGNNVRVTLE